MEPIPMGELRTMFIFSPSKGGDWGMTLESFAAKLRERNPDEFAHVMDLPTDLGPTGPTMYFGITVGEEDLDGIAKTSPQGVALEDCTAGLAAEFAIWLRQHIVPAGTGITFNTQAGMECGLPDEVVPDAPSDEIMDLFFAHLAEVEATE